MGARKGFHWVSTSEGWGFAYVGDVPMWLAVVVAIAALIALITVSYWVGRLVGAGKAREKRLRRESKATLGLPAS